MYKFSLQVADLKDKAAKEGMKSMTQEQVAKIDGEAALLSELHGLGGTI